MTIPPATWDDPRITWDDPRVDWDGNWLTPPTSPGGVSIDDLLALDGVMLRAESVVWEVLDANRQRIGETRVVIQCESRRILSHFLGALEHLFGRREKGDESVRGVGMLAVCIDRELLTAKRGAHTPGDCSGHGRDAETSGDA